MGDFFVLPENNTRIGTINFILVMGNLIIGLLQIVLDCKANIDRSLAFHAKRIQIFAAVLGKDTVVYHETLIGRSYSGSTHPLH